VAPKTRYARSGAANVAFQVTGDGPVDLLVIPGLISHLELDWADPDDARYYRRLGSFCRLIRMDKRGTGLSDPVTSTPTLEDRVADMLAVLDAAGSDQAVVMGFRKGDPFQHCAPRRTLIASRV
jgi:pimeloyl-ACP methyl ester carboxylesterase